MMRNDLCHLPYIWALCLTVATATAILWPPSEFLCESRALSGYAVRPSAEVMSDTVYKTLALRCTTIHEVSTLLYTRT